MWVEIVNVFWIVVSGMLFLMLICTVGYGVWKMAEMSEEDGAKRDALAKETKDLRFAEMSTWEIDLTITRLLYEDRKRRANQRRKMQRSGWRKFA